jgi:hypothetical protein
MMTSPVNVTIAAGSVGGLKANTSTSDNNPQRHGPPLPMTRAVPIEMVIEPELPSNSPINHVDAVTATAGSKTVLQELALNIGAMLRVARKPDETMTALFLRIMAAIEAMPKAERQLLEQRAGLKPLKITLNDLLLALRKPDSPVAARLTAMTEAPTSLPGRAAANAATTTYLQEGDASGQKAETLAMRAAARNSAAGQSVFSPDNKLRAAAPPADGKLLQTQLKTMFEPGQSGRPVPTPAPAAGTDRPASAREPVAAKNQVGQEPRVSAERDPVVISSASLKLDRPTVDRIRSVAQAISSQSPEGSKVAAEPMAVEKVAAKAAEKAESVGDRRVQTLLTLKGFAEAMTSLPARAAELLGAVVAEAAAPATEAQETANPLKPTLSPSSGVAPDTVVTAERAGNIDEAEAALMQAEGAPVEHQSEELVASQNKGTPQSATLPDESTTERLLAERQPVLRPEMAQHPIGFVQAQLQPARDEFVGTVEESDGRDQDDEEGDEEAGEERERKRPRDEYDEIHDPLPEEEPTVIITRDSSEADRAFALYQRMAGF